jgi:hypothetical protein
MAVAGATVHKFTWGANTLTFEEPTFNADDWEESVRGDLRPNQVTNDSTQFVSLWLRQRDFITLHCQFIRESHMEEFWDWWDDIRDGRDFSYYPDADLSAFNTVKIAQDELAPVERGSGLFWFDLVLRVVS